MKVRTSVPLSPMLFVGALALAACGGESSQPSAGPVEVGGLTASAYATSACTAETYATARAANAAYLAGGDEDFVANVINILEANGGKAVEPRFSVKAIGRVAEARNAGRHTGTPAQGGALIDALLTCSSATVSAPDFDFARALTNDGLLVPYGDSPTQTPAITRDGNAGIAAPVNSNFTTWLASPYVVLVGYPVNASTKLEYEFGVIRYSGAATRGEGRFAICAPTDVTNRIFRVPSSGEPSSVLALFGTDFLTCADNVPPASVSSAGASVDSWFAQRLHGLLPDALMAQTATRTRTSSTSTAGSFSKFSVLTRAAIGEVTITVPNLSAIPDTRVNAPLWAGELVISATSSLLTDPNVPGRSPGLTAAVVTLRAVNNNGTPAEFSRLVNGRWVSTGLKELTASANSLGQLSFGSNVGLTKSGGYRLVFTSTYPGYPTQSVTSNGFNVRPK